MLGPAMHWLRESATRQTLVAATLSGVLSAARLPGRSLAAPLALSLRSDPARHIASSALGSRGGNLTGAEAAERFSEARFARILLDSLAP